MTQFCKDCKWCEVPLVQGVSLLEWKCKSPEIPTRENPIDGSSKPLVSFCDIARESKAYCGPDGRWFEPLVEIVGA